MQCFQCGAEQPSENIFCTKCGSRLSRSQPPASSIEAPRETLAVSGSATEEEEKILRELKEALGGVDPDQGPNTASGGKPWNTGKTISLAGGILGLILVAIVVFKLLPKKNAGPALPPPVAVPSGEPPATSRRTRPCRRSNGNNCIERCP